MIDSQGKWILWHLQTACTAVWHHQVHGGTDGLQAGDVVRIGQSQLAFVHDLAKAFPESSARVAKYDDPQRRGNGRRRGHG